MGGIYSMHARDESVCKILVVKCKEIKVITRILLKLMTDL
jgi:hypothetical protein